MIYFLWGLLTDPNWKGFPCRFHGIGWSVSSLVRLNLHSEQQNQTLLPCRDRQSWGRGLWTRTQWATSLERQYLPPQTTNLLCPHPCNLNLTNEAIGKYRPLKILSDTPPPPQPIQGTLHMYNSGVSFLSISDFHMCLMTIQMWKGHELTFLHTHF